MKFRDVKYGTSYPATTLKEAVKLCKAAEKLEFTYRITKKEYQGMGGFPVGEYTYYTWTVDIFDEEPTPDSTMPEEATE